MTITRKSIITFIAISACFFSFKSKLTDHKQSWIRINLLGYPPTSTKVAIWASQTDKTPTVFELIDEKSKMLFIHRITLKPLVLMARLSKQQEWIFLILKFQANFLSG